jgi:hypothetical protein
MDASLNLTTPAPSDESNMHESHGHPNPAHAVAAPVAAAPAAYEFGEAENKVIHGTAWWTRQAGLMLAVFGGVLPMIGGVWSVLRGSLSSVTQILTGLLNLFIGITLVAAARRFNTVVTTQGNDIPLLMDGLKGYQRVFKVLAILVCVAFVLGVAASIVVGILG